MSTILNLKIASETEIDRLLHEPDRIAPFLEEEGPYSEGNSDDLDTSWAALHYLFTGSPDGGQPPRSYLIRGGRSIGNVEVGYELPRFLSPYEVRQFSTFLSTLDEQTLRERYDPGRMNELDIYPGGWREVKQDEILPDYERSPIKYLLDNYRNLKRLVARAADQGSCIIFWLS